MIEYLLVSVGFYGAIDSIQNDDVLLVRCAKPFVKRFTYIINHFENRVECHRFMNTNQIAQLMQHTLQECAQLGRNREVRLLLVAYE